MEEIEDGFGRETGRIANKPSETKETTKKIIRVLTVITYLCSVSMAAIILSLYYLFLWNPSMPSEPARLVNTIEPQFYRHHFNFTSKINRRSSHGEVGSEIKFAGNDNKDKMYEPKHKRKLVRVLTVVGYMFSVSLAAIMLSLFYIFIYNPGKALEGNGKGQEGSRSDGLVVHGAYPRTNEESFSSINDTYSSLEREEPRALPVKEPAYDVQSQLTKPSNSKSIDLSPVEFPPNYTKDNTTILRKLIKFFRLNK